MTEHPFIPYRMKQVTAEDARAQGKAFFDQMDERRSVRFFSDKPVPRELIELAITTASTAPSGAHRQPWQFVAISNPEIKRQIRIAAEKEEYESYEGGRMSDEWLRALEPIGTDWHKPFLETVPWIVVVFEETYRLDDDANTSRNYYVKESVGIACGMFITALHNMGLATLTHTPSPMGFLSEILGRPKNERPFILFPIGYPSDDATVPDLERKPLEEISVWFESE
ncbi:MAG: nitroreductase family protein [Planctomycetota bacterium]